MTFEWLNSLKIMEKYKTRFRRVICQSVKIEIDLLPHSEHFKHGFCINIFFLNQNILYASIRLYYIFIIIISKRLLKKFQIINEIVKPQSYLSIRVDHCFDFRCWNLNGVLKNFTNLKNFLTYRHIKDEGRKRFSV